MVGSEVHTIGRRAPADAQSRAVIAVDPLMDPRWAAFVEQHPDGLLYHHPAWFEALQGEYERPLHGLARVRVADGSWTGVMALLETNGLPLRRGYRMKRRLSSLPRTPYSGPLGLEADDEKALIQAAREMHFQSPDAWLEVKIAPASHLAGGQPDPGFVRWRDNYRIDLPSNVGEPPPGSGKNGRRLRWACRRARVLGIQLSDAASLDDVHRWYPLYLESMRAHAVPPRSLRFFESAWTSLAERGMLRLVLAEKVDASCRRLVAGSVFGYLGATIFYQFDGRAHDAGAHHAGDLIQRETIRWAISSGFRYYDMGEVVDGQEGLASFKRKFGASPSPLARLYLPHPTAPDRDDAFTRSRLRRVACATWRHVPLGATAWAGRAIYGRD